MLEEHDDLSENSVHEIRSVGFCLEISFFCLVQILRRFLHERQ